MSEHVTARAGRTAPDRSRQARVRRMPLRRKCACGGEHEGQCDECRRKRMGVVRKSVAGTTRTDNDVPAIVDRALSEPGRPLPVAERVHMESLFGHDFRDVRIHANGSAAASADAIAARAYTVGHDIVFAGGQYRPETMRGRGLLAHELTHVVQNARSANANRDTASAEASDEREANRAERYGATLETGASRKTASGGAGFDAGRALTRTVAAGSVVPAAKGGVRGRTLRRQPKGTQPQKKKPGTFEKLTHLTFKLGDANFEIDLPSSAKVTLPVQLSSSTRITFALTGKTSGAFTFTATLDGIPHVRIIAHAGVEVGGDHPKASGGITIQATRTVCHAKDEAAIRRDLQSAGDKLKTAIVDMQKLPEALKDVTDEFERVKMTGERAAAVGSAIAALNSVIEKAKEPCKQTPVVSFDFGVQAPLAPVAPTQPDIFGPGSTPRPSPYVGGSLTFHF